MMLMMILSSVTRFGEILAKKLSIWQFLEGLFSLWQFFEPTLGNFYAIGQTFISVNSQILQKCSSPLVTLTLR